MQSRQLNRRQYFNELATTSEKYFIPYIKRYRQVGKGTKVLEIGCGDGGNLLPFSRMGCDVVGVDMAEGRIRDARKFFQENGAKGRFIASDVFLLKELRHQFDLIVCHDVIEHIDDKEEFMHKCKQLLKTGGGNFHVLSCLADAFRWASADMPKPLPLAPAFLSPASDEIV
ncbi:MULTISPECIES: methyltransferase domain-containing protein [Prevotella]|jgi:3-demethylubiquinone-9 3-methyltransferase|uniref:class I SAM-dependent methyltransferase n=1 Tax=Prevotella TaxID=838 RepID=UPI0028F02C9C|nr:MULTISPECIES: methyltransferase domain-containing protein [Prevotellaceae]